MRHVYFRRALTYTVLGMQWNSASPLGRNGQPEDVAKLDSFLMSDESAFITGVFFHSYVQKYWHLT